MISYGALLALFTVSLWALGNCLLALSIHFLDVHPIAFIMQVYIWSGLALLIVGKLDREKNIVTLRETLKAPLTWGYGAAELLLGLFTMLILVHISPAEESFLSRICIPVAVLFGLFFLAKQPSKLDWQCFFPMLIGIGIILIGITPDQLFYITVMVFLAAIVLVLRGLAVEYHPIFAKATNIRQRCRVTGTIVLLSGLFVCATLMGLALLKENIAAISTLFPSLPSVADFTHKPTFYFAVFHGAVVIALTRYLYFRSISLISNTTFLMFAACTPFVTYFMQELLGILGLLTNNPSLSWNLIIGGLLVTLTSLWAAFAREITTSEDAIDKAIKSVTETQEAKIAEEQRFIDALNPAEPKKKK